MNYKKLLSINLLIISIFLLNACVGKKHVTYFEDLQDSSSNSDIQTSQYNNLKIKVDDLLSVNIQTIDPSTNNSINQINNVTTTGINLSSTSNPNSLISGYLVDNNGNIEIPIIGKINVLNYTTNEAKEIIKDKAKAFYKNPTVQIRFTNFKVTVLGEVLRPAPYIMPNEKVSILDAIGLAGDLTIFGKRDNVLVIRDNNGKKQYYRINLNSINSFKSPAFYLQQNDIVYVEANIAKQATLNAYRTQLYSIIGSVLSLLIVALTRIN